VPARRGGDPEFTAHLGNAVEAERSRRKVGESAVHASGGDDELQVDAESEGTALGGTDPDSK
jgi:hypothetical protein